MREILFRGKRTSDGVWVYGNLFIPDNKDTPTQICIGTHIIRITYDVIPETVGQYTGLIDKNGEKIFEGDIFACRYNNSRGKEKVDYYTVTYDDISGIWHPFGDSGRGFNPKSVEIIGNIHDNPESLEEK